MTLPHTYESLLSLHDALIGDALVIQPVFTDRRPEDNRYTVIDVWWKMSVHFHKRYGSPVRNFPDRTRRNMRMGTAIEYAEKCLHEIRNRSKWNKVEPRRRAYERQKKTSIQDASTKDTSAQGDSREEGAIRRNAP